MRGSYRGFEIVGPPPPSSGGVHVIQMLNILEGYDIAGLGFGSAGSAPPARRGAEDRLRRPRRSDGRSRLRRCAGRAADVARPTPPNAARRIDVDRAQDWSAGVAAGESANTTHVTVADAEGNVVASTQTINNLFGARFIVPGTGIVPNNYMRLFDPHPGQALSIAPGKRVTTSQVAADRAADGRPVFALGLPGGLRIFGSAMQALVNLIDHGMSLQEAVEAPRRLDRGLRRRSGRRLPGERAAGPARKATMCWSRRTSAAA